MPGIFAHSSPEGRIQPEHVPPPKLSFPQRLFPKRARVFPSLLSSRRRLTFPAVGVGIVSALGVHVAIRALLRDPAPAVAQEIVAAACAHSFAFGRDLPLLLGQLLHDLLG